MDIMATKAQVESFKESMLWKDFIRELTEWRMSFVSEMMAITPEAEDGNPSTASVLLHMGDLNGRIRAVDYFLGLPDLFIEMIEEKARQTNNNSEVSE